MKAPLISFFIFTACTMFLVSCADDYEIERFDYKAEYDRVSKTNAAIVHSSVEKDITEIIKKRSSYIYSAVGKRDPFRSYFGDMKAVEQDREPVSELQRYDITDLTMTAIVWGITEPRAIIVTPEKKSIIVKRGSFIGKNWGKVSAILQDKIEVIEVYKDPLGRKILNKLYLELPIPNVLNEGRENEQEIRDIESEEDQAEPGSTQSTQPKAAGSRPEAKE
ncbi:MAG TPA: pilus assembly protein PilP [bacterium]|nr:pilus assembly protein PilP [bacterium]